MDKGVPRAGVLIHPATADHIALWENGQHGDNAWPGIPVPAGNGTTGQSAVGRLPSPMGVVTSGGFSFLRGRGVGRGVCEAVAARDALVVSASACRAFVARSGNDANEQARNSSRQQWALVLVRSSVGNDKGNWLRPGLVVVTE